MTTPDRKLLKSGDMQVVDIASILRATSSVEGEFNPHVIRLSQEVERLQWELKGWKGWCEMAREERDDMAGRYWRLQMEKVPGGKV